jgi:hypothetical protein
MLRIITLSLRVQHTDIRNSTRTTTVGIKVTASHLRLPQMHSSSSRDNRRWLMPPRKIPRILLQSLRLPRHLLYLVAPLLRVPLSRHIRHRCRLRRHSRSSSTLDRCHTFHRHLLVPYRMRLLRSHHLRGNLCSNINNSNNSQYGHPIPHRTCLQVPQLPCTADHNHHHNKCNSSSSHRIHQRTCLLVP